MRRFTIVIIVAALVTLMLAPAAVARRGGTDRPFWAKMVGEAYWEFPGVSPSGCEVMTTRTDPIGKATHMGKIRAFWSHCPNEDIFGDGILKIVAANGDELYGSYDYDPFYEFNDIPITIGGGTGRFDGASGEVTAFYDVEPRFTTPCPAVQVAADACFDVGEGYFLDFTVPWPWWASLTGTITY